MIESGSLCDHGDTTQKIKRGKVMVVLNSLHWNSQPHFKWWTLLVRHISSKMIYSYLQNLHRTSPICNEIRRSKRTIHKLERRIPRVLNNKRLTCRIHGQFVNLISLPNLPTLKARPFSFAGLDHLFQSSFPFAFTLLGIVHTILEHQNIMKFQQHILCLLLINFLVL